MGEQIVNLAVKRAVKRGEMEERKLFKVNSFFNHNPSAKLSEVAKCLKTMHHQVDLTLALAKFMKLTLFHKWSPARFRFGIAEQLQTRETLQGSDRECVLLVDMPKGWKVLSTDDFILTLSEYPHKIIEMTEGYRVGVWKRVDTGQQEMGDD